MRIKWRGPVVGRKNLGGEGQFKKEEIKGTVAKVESREGGDGQPERRMDRVRVV